MAQYTKEQIISALQVSKGMVTIAARQLGCTPQTIYNWIKRSPDVRAVIDTEREYVLDTAELNLLAAIQRKESWAIAFALKTIGKQRGYTERLEIDVRYIAIIKQLEAAADNAGIDLADALNDYYAELSAARISADTSESP